MVKAVFADRVERCSARQDRTGDTARSLSKTISPSTRPRFPTLPAGGPRILHRTRRRDPRVVLWPGAHAGRGGNKNSIKLLRPREPRSRAGLLCSDAIPRNPQHEPRRPAVRAGTYLITRASFVACHLPGEIRHGQATVSGGMFLLTRLTRRTKSGSRVADAAPGIAHRPEGAVHVIDATKVARDSGMGRAHQHHHAGLLLRAVRRFAALTKPSKPSSIPSSKLRQERRGKSAHEPRWTTR